MFSNDLMLSHYQALQICYFLENFQRFWFNGGKGVAHSNLRHLYGKSQHGLTNLAFMFQPEFKCLQLLVK